MNKQETIMGVIEAFDEIDRQRVEIAELKMQLTASQRFPLGEADGVSSQGKPFEAVLFAIGQKQTYKDAVSRWDRGVNARRDEETGKVTMKSFETWRDSYVGDVPSFMSEDEFYAYYDERLRADYEQSKQEGLDLLAKEESDD